MSFETTGLQTTAWETALLKRAYAGLQGTAARAHAPIETDTDQLEAAYARCDAITREHSRTFYMASALLPKHKRRAARALYAFCRISDDIVDAQTDDDPAAALEAWRKRVLHPPAAQPPTGVLLAWADTRARYHIPNLYTAQLLDGVAQDFVHQRYPTFEALADYCYGVASTVGLMAMHIVGFRETTAIDYAVKLGVALQLTNILRDVGEDWARGRLYLPLEELAAFGLREADIAAGRVDNRWRDFMRFQIARTRRLYAASLAGVSKLHRDGRFAIRAAAELYAGILDDLEAHDYDAFRRRAYVGKAQKLRRLPGIWWRAKVVPEIKTSQT
ncbi:MAG: squalene/phytoene synthase family protein [Chloroflexi bacterium]|jgi:phytoene synthase|nr:squalene/phytoene synthase family protein [Chloroflexota bacterium]